SAAITPAASRGRSREHLVQAVHVGGRQEAQAHARPLLRSPLFTPAATRYGSLWRPAGVAEEECSDADRQPLSRRRRPGPAGVSRRLEAPDSRRWLRFHPSRMKRFTERVAMAGSTGEGVASPSSVGSVARGAGGPGTTLG